MVIAGWAFERCVYHADVDIRYQLRATEAGLLSVAIPKVVTVGGEGPQLPRTPVTVRLPVIVKRP